LNGVSSFYPDGVKKRSSDLMSDLEEFIGRVTSLKDAVDDPTNIFGDALRDLGDFRKTFEKGVSSDIETMWDDPHDDRDNKIRLPDNLAPTTSDRNDLYVDPGFGPFAPPNPLLPKHWSKDLRASFESSGDENTILGASTPKAAARDVPPVQRPGAAASRTSANAATISALTAKLDRTGKRTEASDQRTRAGRYLRENLIFIRCNPVKYLHKITQMFSAVTHMQLSQYRFLSHKQ
jgi:hypothetical protein